MPQLRGGEDGQTQTLVSPPCMLLIYCEPTHPRPPLLLCGIERPARAMKRPARASASATPDRGVWFACCRRCSVRGGRGEVT
eukprot:1247805-Rhodomonas_salina.3